MREELMTAIQRDIPGVKNCVILSYALLRIEDENGNAIQQHQPMTAS
jgi:hypothetical protein